MSYPVIEVNFFQATQQMRYLPPNLRTERNPISETPCFLVFRTSDDGQSPKKPVILSKQVVLKDCSPEIDRFLYNRDSSTLLKYLGPCSFYSNGVVLAQLRAGSVPHYDTFRRVLTPHESTDMNTSKPPVHPRAVVASPNCEVASRNVF
jgi:hypothetical protein